MAVLGQIVVQDGSTIGLIDSTHIPSEYIIRVCKTNSLKEISQSLGVISGPISGSPLVDVG